MIVYEKKLILLILSLSFLLGFNINVSAATIEVDKNIPAKVDTNSYLITSEGGITFTSRDSGYFYKTIDSFYNENTNVITYEFTNTFKTFLASTAGTDNDYSELTVEQYMQIIGATEDEMQSGSAQLKNDLDKLYSLFAIYVKKNSIKADNQDFDISGNSYFLTSNVNVGTYLVLNLTKMHAVMVANLQFEAVDGEWVLDNVELVAKSGTDFGLTNIQIAINGVSKGDYTFQTSANIGDKLTYMFDFIVPKFPTNALTKTFRIIFKVPEGIDLTNGLAAFKFSGTGQNFENDGNGNIIDSDTKIVVGKLSTDDEFIYLDFETDNILVSALRLSMDFKLNNKAIVGKTGNAFGLGNNYTDDPYDEDGIEASYTEDMYIIYTYGLTVSLTDKDNQNVFLPGTEFKIYDATDTEFENEIGTITIGEDGTASLVGIKEGSYVLRQTKAVAGYHKNSDIAFSFTNADVNDEGYLVLDLTNQKYSLLPFTGGAGTLTYTLWGLILIGVSAFGIILYKKKHQVNL